MANSKRATVYFDPGLHEALRAKAAQTARSVSDLVNAAVRQIWTRTPAIWPRSARGGTNRTSISKRWSRT